jgi:hypothetical protein
MVTRSAQFLAFVLRDPAFTRNGRGSISMVGLRTMKVNKQRAAKSNSDSCTCLGCA